MKSNTINSVLTGVLAVSLLLSVVFCLQYTFQTRELRQLSAQVNAINVNRTSVQALANDCLEYSKKNPAIDPILESVNMNPKVVRANAKPAAK